MFDIDKLKRLTAKPRTAQVPVKPLAALFDGEAAFTVRGLTGEEYAIANEAAKGYSQVGQILSGILSAQASDKVAAIKSSLGLSGDLPEDYARRIEYLLLGCVEPPGLDREAAVKIAAVAPVEFYWLTNEILRLSGEGAELVGE